MDANVSKMIEKRFYNTIEHYGMSCLKDMNWIWNTMYWYLQGLEDFNLITLEEKVMIMDKIRDWMDSNLYNTTF